jgi:hypothetical protein
MNSQDKSFAEFRRRAKCSFPGMSDQVIRSTWKRGRHSAKVHVLRCQCQDASDIYVSLSYGELHFKSVIGREKLHELADQWQQHIAGAPDPRAFTNMAILKCLIGQDQEYAVTLTAATLWLAMKATTFTWDAISDGTYKGVHYEITEIADRNGHGHNFRLVLMRDDEPLPDLVHTLPSPFNGM